MIYLPSFRAWDIKNKKMGEPDIIINNGRIDEVKIWGDETIPEEETDWRESSEFSLMMSSNVLDIKKKEIYDLDILKSTASEFPEDHKYWIVTHEDGGFNVRYYFLPKDKRKRSIAENELLCKDNVDWYKFEIVGNVYQNPELLSSDLKKLLRRKEK